MRPMNLDSSAACMTRRFILFHLHSSRSDPHITPDRGEAARELRGWSGVRASHDLRAHGGDFPDPHGSCRPAWYHVCHQFAFKPDRTIARWPGRFLPFEDVRENKFHRTKHRTWGVVPWSAPSGTP